jgi:hypothetical protein
LGEICKKGRGTKKRGDGGKTGENGCTDGRNSRERKRQYFILTLEKLKGKKETIFYFDFKKISG